MSICKDCLNFQKSKFKAFGICNLHKSKRIIRSDDESCDNFNDLMIDMFEDLMGITNDSVSLS